MEEGFYKAIAAIEQATGQRPKRIEMPNGVHIVVFSGVEFLLDSSQAGYMLTKYNFYGVVK